VQIRAGACKSGVQQMKFPILFLAAGLSASFSSFAQQQSQTSYPDNDVPVQQERMLITASRSEQSQVQAMAATSVISREDIEYSGAPDIVSLLTNQPGIDIARTGAAGQQTSIFMRGTNSNHVLVLIDGVRTNSAHTGGFSWEHLSLAQIEHIEIVRGPRASLYGSDAIGGVIHIFTRNGTSAEISAGSFNSMRAAAGYSSNSLSATISHQDIGGISSQNENGFSFNPDDDGYENTSITARWKSNGFSAQTYYMTSDTQFDEGATDVELLILAAGYHGEVSSNWQYDVQLSWLDDQLETPVYFSKTDAQRSHLDVINSLQTQAGMFQFGVNYQHEEGKSNSYRDQRDNSAVFAQLMGGEKITYQVAARYDHNSEFGSKLTGQLALGHRLGENVNVFASIGTGFRTPNLSEQFSPGFFGYYAGNPDLDPEQSISTEIGSRIQLSEDVSLTANIFYTEVTDLISFSGGETFQAININEVRMKGLELVYVLRKENWSLGANATLQDTENKLISSRLLRRADTKLGLNASYQLTRNLSLYSEVQHTGDRDDFGATLESFTLFNARLDYQLNSNWGLGLRLDNLADEDYALAYGFNTPGRSAYVNIRFNP